MNNEKSISIIIESLKIIILKFIKNNLEEFFNNKTEYIDEMLFFLFPDNSNQRILLLKVATLFLILYTEFYNKELENETTKIYDYVNFYGQRKYKINYKILDSVYVLIGSLIESDSKIKNNNLLKTFDNVLTKNIDKLQEREDIDYNPYKTPVIREILDLIIPLFDSLKIYNLINNK